MTTSHRPTFHAALGGPSRSGVVSGQMSAKDQVGYTKLKFRNVGQSSTIEMEDRDLRQELNIRENQYMQDKKKALELIEDAERKIDVDRVTTLLLTTDAQTKNYDDADVEVDYSDDELQESDEEEEDDDEDDDELELQRELERIKEERAIAQAKKEQEERAIQELGQRESALKGNPLVTMDDDSSSKIKRRWNDDVVFKNQTRGEPEAKKRFINDTIRNDFHKSFLKKFIQ